MDLNTQLPMNTTTTPRPEGQADNGPCDVPLIEQLRSVPKDWREMREVGHCHHRNVPYGAMLHRAADELERLATPQAAAAGEGRSQRIADSESQHEAGHAPDFDWPEAAAREIAEDMRPVLEQMGLKPDAINGAMATDTKQYAAIIRKHSLAGQPGKGATDTERLDWLEQQARPIMGQTVHNLAWRHGKPLRSAIDSARAQSPQDKGETP
jgi:hypothetical protein